MAKIRTAYRKGRSLPGKRPPEAAPLFTAASPIPAAGALTAADFLERLI